MLIDNVIATIPSYDAGGADRGITTDRKSSPELQSQFQSSQAILKQVRGDQISVLRRPGTLGIFSPAPRQSASSPRARNGGSKSSYERARSPIGPGSPLHSSIGVRLGPNAAVSSTPAANSSRRVRRHFSQRPQFSSLPGFAGTDAQSGKRCRPARELAHFLESEIARAVMDHGDALAGE